MQAQLIPVEGGKPITLKKDVTLVGRKRGLAALIGTCSSTPSILDQVLDTGELRVVTRYSPTSYTITPDGPTGPEFDLVQSFADDLGVALVMEPVASVSEILPMLLSGEAHMAAAGLSITESRQVYLNFGHPYETVDVHLIYKLGLMRRRRSRSPPRRGSHARLV